MHNIRYSIGEILIQRVFNMHPGRGRVGKKAVKRALIEADLTISRLAEMTGFSRGHLYGVVSGRHKSMRARKIVALALKRDFEELWAEEQSGEPSAESRG